MFTWKECFYFDLSADGFSNLDSLFKDTSFYPFMYAVPEKAFKLYLETVSALPH